LTRTPARVSLADVGESRAATNLVGRYDDHGVTSMRRTRDTSSEHGAVRKRNPKNQRRKARTSGSVRSAGHNPVFT